MITATADSYTGTYMNMIVSVYDYNTSNGKVFARNITTYKKSTKRYVYASVYLYNSSLSALYMEEDSSSSLEKGDILTPNITKNSPNSVYARYKSYVRNTTSSSSSKIENKTITIKFR
ncbi:MAG: hypothetical protein LUE12_07730 [Ruminococcus sp.]|nr:hypothetical protein [Ruminococcus sp.]